MSGDIEVTAGAGEPVRIVSADAKYIVRHMYTIVLLAPVAYFAIALIFTFISMIVGRFRGL
jgi:hypothetical protein